MLIFIVPCLTSSHITLQSHQESRIHEAAIETHYEDPFDVSMIGYASLNVPAITGAMNVVRTQGKTSRELIEAGNRALARWFKRFQKAGTM